MADDIYPITVPKWGISMEDGVVVEWHRAEGVNIAYGDDLLDIETSKIINTVEASDSGILKRVVENMGSPVFVGQLLGVIANENVDASSVDAYIQEFQDNYIKPDVEETEESKANFVEIGTQRLHYLFIESENHEAVPIILIHGFGGDCNNWLFNINDLANEQSVYALDLPGHGASSKDVGIGSLSQLAESVIAFMDEVGVRSAHLIGHSMGAAVAMKVAQTQSDRAASLALISPSGLGERINEAYIRGFVESQKRRELKQSLGMLFADKSLVTRQMVDDILKYKRLDGVTDALRQIADEVFSAVNQKDSFRPFLSEHSSLPVTIIWGDKDEIANPEDRNGLGAAISTNLLTGVGHMPHMEAATEVNKLLLLNVT